MHLYTKNKIQVLLVRAYLEDARKCEVIDSENLGGPCYELKRITEDGLFEGIIVGRIEFFEYLLRVESYSGEIRQFSDPYSFLPTLSDDDVHLFREGSDHRVHKKMGSHFCTKNGVTGVSFALWAPAAIRVSVVGEFNNWNGRYHPMRRLGAAGIWELFIPALELGIKYKYELSTTSNTLLLKSDPYGTFFEAPPYNSSIVYPVDSTYKWSDTSWIERRVKTDWKNEPISIYEMHLGSWKSVIDEGGRSLSYRELANELVEYIKDMHYTHVEFMPLSEHPYDASWGYQVTGFFAPTQRFGTPEDFMYLVDTLHQNEIGVIMDWVPAHFPKDSFALSRFDGTAQYEYADPRQGLHQDWGTLIFNYGREEVRGFLIASALSWCERYHIDGLRVDAVASMLYLDYSRKEGQWIPNKYGGRENLEAIEFLRQTNDLVHKYFPGTLMIAEESTAFPGVTSPTSEGGLGFDMKWNMGWMHDTLNYFEKDPIHRKFEHKLLSFGMLYQYSENFCLVFSHDEIVHGKSSMLYKMPGDSISDKANQLRSLYALMWMWPGKKTLFMGNDFGQSSEWNHSKSLDWHLLEYLDHRGIQKVVRDLNRLYREIPGLAEGDNSSEAFEWINCTDADNSVLSFIRKGHHNNDDCVVVGNFTPLLRESFRVGVPHSGIWKEVMNTDSKDYGGHGFGNSGDIRSDPIEWDSHPHSILIQLPPQSMSIFRFHNKL
ncbi:MAG: 1,4-alpha-glucan branching protein GlgB [Verrucomicrobiota bacterium]|nr:1,4-alpha-glucan branching protein GlgB [Verrucomicrobiota bacterium]